MTLAQALTSATAAAAVCALAWIAPSGDARAADNPAWTACGGGPGVSPDRQIDACTQVLQSPSQPPANLALAYYQRGAAHEANRDYAAAVADLDRAVRLVPGLAEAYLARGDAYYQIGDRGRAIDDYGRAIALKPDAAVAYNNRCWARAEGGTGLEAALADCEAAIRLRPAFAGALGSRAYVDFRLGRFAKAVADADAALGFNAQANAWRAGSLYVRGVAKLRLRDLSGQTDLAAAQAIDPRIGVRYAAYGVTP